MMPVCLSFGPPNQQAHHENEAVCMLSNICAENQTDRKRIECLLNVNSKAFGAIMTFSNTNNGIRGGGPERIYHHMNDVARLMCLSNV